MPCPEIDFMKARAKQCWELLTLPRAKLRHHSKSKDASCHFPLGIVIKTFMPFASRFDTLGSLILFVNSQNSTSLPPRAR